MKKWEMPVIEELKIGETEQNWFGVARDGGYVGDTDTQGHTEWESQ